MIGKKGSENYIKFFIYLIVIILINLAATTFFFRIDLTENGSYSISKASKEVVSTLSEPLTINVFFTKNLPAPHNSSEQYIRDLLEEYSLYSKKFFNYRFFDVSPDEGDMTPEAKKNQELARSYGVNPIQIQIVDNDEVKFQKAYMGLVIIHGDMIKKIPTITSTEMLEYQLTTAIMKLNNKISAFVSLEGKIKIQLILSSSLNKMAPLMGLKGLSEVPKQLKGIVDKLNEEHYNKLDFEHLDPTANPELEKQIESKENVIMGLKWDDIPEKNISAGKGSIGLLLSYGEKAIPVRILNVMNIPIFGPRYELADMKKMEAMISENIESLIDINENLGYLADHGTRGITPALPFMPAPQQDKDSLGDLYKLVSDSYLTKEINLKEENIPNSLNCLMIVRPTETFTDYELYQIDQFVMQGKNLIVFPDQFNEVMPPRQMGMGQGPRYMPIETGLEKLLEHYGVRIKKSYVLDENCYKQVKQMNRGGGEMPIYFAPLVENRFINKELGFIKNIKQLLAIKVSPLELNNEKIKEQGLTAVKLLSSTEKAWEMRGQINLNPMFISPPASADKKQSFPLAYLLEGKFSSYFTGKPIPEKKIEIEEKDKKEANKTKKNADAKTDGDLSKITSTGNFRASSEPAKIFVMASSDMLSDSLLNYGRSNSIFVMNLIDYLNNREDIAFMRSKKQQFNPLEPSEAGTKTFVKSFNIVGLPIVVIIFGLLVWLRRVSRKKQIQMMFQK